MQYWSVKYLALYVQFWAPGDGRKTRLKHAERFTEINKLRNVAPCWLCSANILAMHGPMNIKWTLFIHSFKSLQIGCSVLDDNERCYKQRTARRILSRYVSATNTVKGKSHVPDSEIGCYPPLSMDPFQTNCSYLSVYLLKENPITRTRVGIVCPLGSTAVKLWDVSFSPGFRYVRPCWLPARSERGASRRNAPSKHLDVPISNSLSTTDKQADQPDETVRHTTPSTCCLCWAAMVGYSSINPLNTELNPICQ